MAGFNAGSVVETLDWDFTDFLGPDAKGVTPEPSNKQIANFGKAMEAMKRGAIVLAQRQKAEMTGDDPDKVKSVEDLTDAEYEHLLAESERFAEGQNEAMSMALEALTSGSPSREQFEGLPFRVQRAYMEWLGEQIRPEGRTPASK